MSGRSPGDYLRFIEASVALAVASVAVRVLPFRALVSLMRLGGAGFASDGLEVGEVRTALDRASRRLPLRLVCIQRGLAVHWMLRRRGFDSRLCYGIRPFADRLSAHVWVELGDEVVVGEEERSAAHHQVAMFPAPVQGRKTQC